MAITIERHNGLVRFGDNDGAVSFEALEEVYKIIKPTLEKRREKNIAECQQAGFEALG